MKNAKKAKANTLTKRLYLTRTIIYDDDDSKTKVENFEKFDI